MGVRDDSDLGYLCTPTAQNDKVGQDQRDLAAEAPGPAQTPLKLVERIIAGRSKRRRFLRPDLFVEPDWNMLLDLYAATLRGQRVSVSSLTIAANIPPTTALRHIGHMEKNGEIIRESDPLDRRRSFLKLSPETFGAMSNWLASISGDGLFG